MAYIGALQAFEMSCQSPGFLAEIASGKINAGLVVCCASPYGGFVMLMDVAATEFWVAGFLGVTWALWALERG